MDYSLTERKKFSDDRGFLIEFLKKSELGEEKSAFGQIYLAIISPGTIRGNHYHTTKDEYFAVVNGKVFVILEDVATGERVEFTLDSAQEKVSRLRVGANVAHAITNVGDSDVVLCAYTDKEYDPANLDQEDYQIT
ncbi:MAG: dTDP-4-dehydrorhamnose 3,5-epimerase family protein [Proteobacteria bacterium]|nr:dTDP-4-dehydrorhamnose 3,5-epimerase family protein [Pseudomonadota bacterium]